MRQSSVCWVSLPQTRLAPQRRAAPTYKIGDAFGKASPTHSYVRKRPMDKLEHYRSCIQTLLEKHSQYKFRDEDIESALFFDPVRDHYQLMRIGWKGLKRIYYTVLHFDIKDGRIWLQQNTTDIDVGEELLSMGVPKEDIILGLHPPYKRPYTNYGVA